MCMMWKRVNIGRMKGRDGNSPPPLSNEEDEVFTCEIDVQRLWQTCWV